MNVRAAVHLIDSLPVVDLRAGKPVGDQIDNALASWLPAQRWFDGKDVGVAKASINDMVKVTDNASLAMLRVQKGDGSMRRYAHLFSELPVDTLKQRSVDKIEAPLAVLRRDAGDTVLVDGMGESDALRGLIQLMHTNSKKVSDTGSLTAHGGSGIDDAMRGANQLQATIIRANSSNTLSKVTMPDGSTQVVKLVRGHDDAFEAGTPTRALDVVKGEFLTNKTSFHNTPRINGSIDHVDSDGVTRTVAVSSDFVPHDGDAWADAVSAAGKGENYEQMARIQGQRLGELHAALASGGINSEFKAVKPTLAQLKEANEGFSDSVSGALEALQRSGRSYSSDFEQKLNQVASSMKASKDSVSDWIHGHGDFHLGQMLTTSNKGVKDVQIVDLEGAPGLALSKRWERSDPLIDVARNMSSYEYAAHEAKGDPKWANTAAKSFLDGWRKATAGKSFVPAGDGFDKALNKAQLENALYELRYELASRPDGGFVDVPFSRAKRIIEAS